MEWAARFWAKVNREGPLVRPALGRCWVWTGAKIKGYGAFRIGGRDGRTLGAHRCAWLLAEGVEPRPGMQVCHRCDNPACVRPAHLFEGTGKDNARDRERKGRGRQVRGARHGRALLTEATVRSVMKLRKKGLTQHQTAALLGITRTAVADIDTGRRWKHLTGVGKA